LDIDFADAVADASLGFSRDLDSVTKVDVGLAFKKTEKSAPWEACADLDAVVEALGFDADTFEIAAASPLVAGIVAAIGFAVDRNLDIVAIPSLNINLAEGIVD